MISTRPTSLHHSPNLTDHYFLLAFLCYNKDTSLVNNPALLNATCHRHTSTTGLGMPYRRASMTHISHSGARALRRNTLSYSIGSDRCYVTDGKTLGLINASILGSYIYRIRFFPPNLRISFENYHWDAFVRT